MGPQGHAPEPALPTQTGGHLCPGNVSPPQDRGQDKCFFAALDYVKYPTMHGPGSEPALPLSVAPRKEAIPPASLHGPSWMELL